MHLEAEELSRRKKQRDTLNLAQYLRPQSFKGESTVPMQYDREHNILPPAALTFSNPTKNHDLGSLERFSE